VVVGAVAGAYLATRGPSAGSNNNPTPSPGTTSNASPSAITTPTPSSNTPSPSQTNAVGTASSLQFSIDITSAGVAQGTYTYMAKNAGTNNLMLRIEMKDTNGATTFIYIVNGAQQKAWMYDGTTWTDLSASFSTQWSSWDSAFAGYQNSLAGWAGLGDYTYTAPNGDSVRYYNIAVNPTLADSLFQHS
jgi:hypothetical protein